MRDYVVDVALTQPAAAGPDSNFDLLLTHIIKLIYELINIR